jgi:hypothetical protein
MSETHHIPNDRPGPSDERLQALCGVKIRRDESDPNPTCLTCREFLERTNDYTLGGGTEVPPIRRR